MNLDRAFTLSSILLAGAGFGSLALTADVPNWLLVLGTTAWIVSLLQAMSNPKRIGWVGDLRLSSRSWNLVLLAAFAGFWIDLLWISQELLSAGIRFLIILMINKLFNLQQRRDFLQLYAISLMAILASASLTTQVWYAPVFLAYLITGVWTLLLYHLTSEREVSARGHTGPSFESGSEGHQITMRFFWATNGAALGAVCLTLSIFFIIPRVGIGLLQKTRGEGLRTTGFAEKVDLGVMGSIKQDPSIVMRVKLPDIDRARPTLYLRGMAYDHYTGRSWRTDLPARRPLVENPQGTFTLRHYGAQPTETLSPDIQQDIILEPLDTPVLFGMPGATAVTGDLLGLQADTMDALFLPFPPSIRMQYTVRSRAAFLHKREQSAGAFLYPNSIRQHYLQLPPLSQRISELSRNVAQDSRSPYESVQLIKRHLLANYRYSLDLDNSRSGTPLEEFLFVRKSGYCEHYATAMIVMLRAIGIPSRLVTGFLASEWNEFGNYYTVRQRDAHAWVEVYFPQSGWITFDPTPPVAQAEGNRWWQSLEGLTDSVRLQWDRLFVQYSAADQLAVLQGVRDGGDTLRTTLLASFNLRLIQVVDHLRAEVTALPTVNARQAALMAGVIISALLLLATLRHLHRKPWVRMSRRNRAPEPRVFAARIYSQMTACLIAHGIRRAVHHTPAELLRQVEDHWTPAVGPVRDLITLYCRIRFGRYPLTPEEVSAAQGLLRQIRELAK